MNPDYWNSKNRGWNGCYWFCFPAGQRFQIFKYNAIVYSHRETVSHNRDIETRLSNRSKKSYVLLLSKEENPRCYIQRTSLYWYSLSCFVWSCMVCNYYYYDCCKPIIWSSCVLKSFFELLIGYPLVEITMVMFVEVKFLILVQKL